MTNSRGTQAVMHLVRVRFPQSWQSLAKAIRIL
jgi:hypothetical protein